MKALKKAEKTQQAEATNRAIPAAPPTGVNPAQWGLDPEPRRQGSAPGIEALAAEFTGGADADPDQRALAEIVATGTRARQARGTRSSLMPISAALAAIFILGWGAYVYMAMRVPTPAIILPPAPGIIEAVKMDRPNTAIVEVAPAPETSRVEPALAPEVKQAPVSEVGTKAFAAEAPASKPRLAPANAVSGGERVTITSSAAGTALNPVLVRAYQAYQGGRLDEAETQYQQALKSEPRSRDALLGLAAIAVQQGKLDLAARHYYQLLQIDPHSSVAQAGLINLGGMTDPRGAEVRLKALLATQSSAFVYFTLGNLYADQSRWPEAEQAYFQAQQIESDNPDYVFNLAVSLEQLYQPKLALPHYQRAQQLLALKGHANFNAAQLAARIAQLSAAKGQP